MSISGNLAVYNIDGITIYHGDSATILPGLDEQVNLCLTDPPFGINYQNNYTHQLHDKISGDCGTSSYSEWAKHIYSMMKNNTAMFAFTGWSEYPHHYEEIQRCGFDMKEPLIVQKRPSGTSDLYGTFQSNADWIIFAHKGRFRFRQTNLLRNKAAGVIPNRGRKPVAEWKTRFQSCWFGPEYPWSTENPASIPFKWRHPTLKTIKLMEWIILLTTDENDLIIDPYMGSGSTLIAARNLNRRAIGIEIEERHCKTAIDRLTSQSLKNMGDTNAR